MNAPCGQEDCGHTITRLVAALEELRDRLSIRTDKLISAEEAEKIVVAALRDR